MKRLIALMGLLALVELVPAAWCQKPGDEVVVIYNTRVPESRDVALHYAERRQIAASRVFGFDLPNGESMYRADFQNRLELPLLKALKQQKLWLVGPRDFLVTNGPPRRVEGTVTAAKIRYAVLCFGVPLKIYRDPNLHEDVEKIQKELRRDEAAVDSELACLPLVDQKYQLTGLIANPLYGTTNAALLNPTNGVLMVTRLDGPTAAIARALVDKAMQAEADGLWGRAYFDLQGLTQGNYKQGDDWIRNASEISRRLGFETVVDDAPGTFPARFPLSQVALYAGWYSEHVDGPFAQPAVEFMPGAFAYHLHSFSAATIRSATHQWVGPLLAKGATATMGTVDEPYLALTPDMSVFFARFLGAGFTFGEAAYAAQNCLSWQTTVVGDPLYRPFARGPQEQHEALVLADSKWLEWSYLRLVNLQLANHGSPTAAISTLEGLSLTRQSSVLTEKLADLYFAEGKPSSSVHTLKQVLELGPSPQQRVRVMLEMADRLIPLDREGEAYSVLQEFLKDCPAYPDLIGIYQRLVTLVQKLGKKEDASAYEQDINRLQTPAAEPPKGPPARRGI